MFGRIWNWIIGNQKLEINVNIHIEDLEKLLKVLPNSSTQPVIIEQEKKSQTVNESKESRQPGRKKLADDPLTSDEVASIMLADGIEKATDRTGSEVVSSSEGNSTDDTVSSLKQFRRTKKDG